MAKLSVLYDDFTTKDTTKWTWGAAAAVSGGRAQLTANTSYTGQINTATNYDCTGCSLFVQIVQELGQAGGAGESFFGCGDNANLTAAGVNSLFFYVTNSLIVAQKNVAGTQSAIFSGTFNAANHAWRRLRESAGTVYFEVSANGLTWNALDATAHIATPAFYSNAVATLWTGYVGTPVPSPVVVIADNLNIAPAAGRIINRAPLLRASLH